MSDNMWFVTYRLIGSFRGRGEYRRLSETFSTELDAKKFATARVADARDITAGTINPHLPKRTIGSAQIADWLKEEMPEAPT